MGDSLPWTPMNSCAKFDAASFILAGKIRKRTNKRKKQTANNISTPCLWAYVDHNNNNNNKCLSTRISNGIQPPVDSDIHKQRKWDKTVIDAEFNHYSEPYHKARLLAAAAPHSGDWLHALPISACGLHLEDNAIRVAVGLRLSSAICETHTWPCGATVDLSLIHI